MRTDQSQRLQKALKLILLGSFLATAAHAQPTYTPPRVLSGADLDYPNYEHWKNQEGYVVISHTISTEGKAEDIVILHSTGSKYFEEEALKSVRNTEFAPATMNGQPVVSSRIMPFTFYKIGGVRGVSRKFRNDYERLNNSLVEQDQEAALAAIEEIQSRGIVNLYEESLFNISRYQYEAIWGTKTAQIQYLERALLFENRDQRPSMLPEETLETVRRDLFKLQVQSLRFKDAMYTYERFAPNGDTIAHNTYVDLYGQLADIADDGKEYSMTVDTDHNGLWSISLYKRNIQIEPIEGALSQTRLYCQSIYQADTIELSANIEVPNGSGECRLVVVGEPDSRFRIVFN